MPRSTVLLTLFVTALSVPSPQAAPAAHPAAALPGWTARSVPPAAQPCVVDLPRLPLRQAVTTMLQRPAELPRPTLRCEAAAASAVAVALPLAADPMLLERVEGSEPTLAWTPRIEVLTASDGLLLVDIDVIPFLPPPSGPSALLGKRPTAPAIRQYEAPRFRADPSRPGSDEPLPAAFTAEIVPPAIAVRRLENIDADVLAIFSSGAWLAVDLAVERGRMQWYRISPAEYFPLPGRIVLAPTPRHPRSLLELLAIDPATGAVTSLGRPAAKATSWRQELSDLRERAGLLEALVIVRDASAHRAEDAPVFGALLRLEGGAWKQVDSQPLPAGAEPRSLRFDPADPRALLLVTQQSGQDVAWSRRLP